MSYAKYKVKQFARKEITNTFSKFSPFFTPTMQIFFMFTYRKE